mmetsp:Transcript_34346/g.110874  ORF Transcript_34346/g.110874 Transcript_34346/m.110874 type:complete len:243 (+) Transcript_34346:938-1666(+)
MPPFPNSTGCGAESHKPPGPSPRSHRVRGGAESGAACGRTVFRPAAIGLAPASLGMAGYPGSVGIARGQWPAGCNRRGPRRARLVQARARHPGRHAAFARPTIWPPSHPILRSARRRPPLRHRTPACRRARRARDRGQARLVGHELFAPGCGAGAAAPVCTSPRADGSELHRGHQCLRTLRGAMGVVVLAQAVRLPTLWSRRYRTAPLLYSGGADRPQAAEHYGTVRSRAAGHLPPPPDDQL